MTSPWSDGLSPEEIAAASQDGWTDVHASGRTTPSRYEREFPSLGNSPAIPPGATQALREASNELERARQANQYRPRPRPSASGLANAGAVSGSPGTGRGGLSALLTAQANFKSPAQPAKRDRAASGIKTPASQTRPVSMRKSLYDEDYDEEANSFDYDPSSAYEGDAGADDNLLEERLVDIINDTRRKPDDEATRNELADLAAELSSESESEAPAAADAASEEEPADSPRVAGSPSEEARPNPSPPRARSRARAPFPVELRGPPMRTHAPKVGRFKMTAVDKFTLATQGVLFANAPDVHAMCGASVIAQAVHAAARKARGVEMWLVGALFAALGNQWSKGVRVVATVSDEEGEIAYKTMPSGIYIINLAPSGSNKTGTLGMVAKALDIVIEVAEKNGFGGDHKNAKGVRATTPTGLFNLLGSHEAVLAFIDELRDLVAACQGKNLSNATVDMKHVILCAFNHDKLRKNISNDETVVEAPVLNIFAMGQEHFIPFLMCETKPQNLPPEVKQCDASLRELTGSGGKEGLWQRFDLFVAPWFYEHRTDEEVHKLMKEHGLPYRLGFDKLPLPILLAVARATAFAIDEEVVMDEEAQAIYDEFFETNMGFHKTYSSILSFDAALAAKASEKAIRIAANIALADKAGRTILRMRRDGDDGDQGAALWREDRIKEFNRSWDHPQEAGRQKAVELLCEMVKWCGRYYGELKGRPRLIITAQHIRAAIAFVNQSLMHIVTMGHTLEDVVEQCGSIWSWAARGLGHECPFQVNDVPAGAGASLSSPHRSAASPSASSLASASTGQRAWDTLPGRFDPLSDSIILGWNLAKPKSIKGKLPVVEGDTTHDGRPFALRPAAVISNGFLATRLLQSGEWGPSESVSLKVYEVLAAIMRAGAPIYGKFFRIGWCKMGEGKSPITYYLERTWPSYPVPAGEDDFDDSIGTLLRAFKDFNERAESKKKGSAIPVPVSVHQWYLQRVLGNAETGEPDSEGNANKPTGKIPTLNTKCFCDYEGHLRKGEHEVRHHTGSLDAVEKLLEGLIKKQRSK